MKPLVTVDVVGDDGGGAVTTLASGVAVSEMKEELEVHPFSLCSLFYFFI